ncbi:MAG: glycosyltransferase family 4 protein [Myxococcota bacterium]
MRLLMITQDFPPQTGGIQTYSAELARRFCAACERFELVAPADDGCAAVDAALPYPVHRLRVPSDRMVFATLRQAASIAGDRFDAVFHAQWYTLPAGLLLRRRGKVRRVFVAAHGRELLLNVVERIPGVGVGYAAARDAMLRRVDLHTPVSRYTGGLLEAAGVAPEAMHIAPNGVDPHTFSPGDGEAFRRARGLGESPLLMTVCRLVPRKGIDTTIEALPKIRAAVPDVRYAIGGSGPDRARLEGLVAHHGLEDVVTFLGRVPDEAMRDAMTAADVFCMPARSDPPDVEGFGLVFLEAGACGTAVVGARAGGVPDAIVHGETGLLVEPGEADALADALVSLLQDPERCAAFGTTARARIEQGCTWDHVAEGLLDAMRARL